LLSLVPMSIKVMEYSCRGKSQRDDCSWSWDEMHVGVWPRHRALLRDDRYHVGAAKEG
jgi:hypothetical protein